MENRFQGFSFSGFSWANALGGKGYGQKDNQDGQHIPFTHLTCPFRRVSGRKRHETAAPELEIHVNRELL